MKNIEIDTSIKFTDSNGSHVFMVGDNVICCTGEKEYKGIIVNVGHYNGVDGSFDAFYLDTTDRTKARSYSGEIINVNNIVSIRHLDESGERERFTAVLKELGYGVKKVDELFPKIQNIRHKFGLSFEQATASVIYALVNHCSIEIPLRDMVKIDDKGADKKVDDLLKISKVANEQALQAFDHMVKIVAEAILKGEITYKEAENWIYELCGEMSDLEKQAAVKVLEAIKKESGDNTQ
ncbi:MAG TPA: hypothetical protein H9717_05170 [Candidatus Eisenbergiella merdipullorum]|uniref:Uncharacterized protein n=1 Tax=Candidatus Eisenbergiella merdipullorum TaxID=2838553 RepID=A0A9D2L0K6_9FIRM|nr:hypothetical protein [Candidatus Eisenbergiella merdipullorum]